MIDNTFTSIIDGRDLTRDQLLRLLPTFTIGSGAVAYVLCHESLSKTKHRVLGGATRSATQHCDLCVGNVDYHLVDSPPLGPVMETESSKLIAAAALLGARTWGTLQRRSVGARMILTMYSATRLGDRLMRGSTTQWVSTMLRISRSIRRAGTWYRRRYQPR